MTMRDAFEVWLRKRGVEAVKTPDGLRYADPAVQQCWRIWRSSWSVALSQTAEGARCWIPRSLMERIHRTLAFYGNPGSYQPSVGAGFFKRCLPGTRPTPQDLALSAQTILQELETGKHLQS